ncbi:AAA family ATPase [bacterium]|nr:AAA family ATPase [bacterium]
MNMLKRIQVEGFKSIRKMDLELGPINVLIGANGAGKSNFVSLFEMLQRISTEEFQLHIAVSGGANSVLHYGSNITREISIDVTFRYKASDKDEKYIYSNKIITTLRDTLIFGEEYVLTPHKEPIKLFQEGFRESGLRHMDTHSALASVPLALMTACKPFQFNDTSSTALIRKSGYIRDYNYLKSDAGNLAAFLYMLHESKQDYYKRIISTIKLAAPFFGDFILKPDKLNSNMIMLNWREIKSDSDYIFGPHQLPNGLLRFIALVTLLLQPKEYLPQIIIIDEPELGLHPAAINILGALIRKVSHHRQVIIATQSVNLVDNFTPEELIIVERKAGESIFKKTTTEEIKDWLEDYTLSELWEKNVIGGRP